MLLFIRCKLDQMFWTGGDTFTTGFTCFFVNYCNSVYNMDRIERTCLYAASETKTSERTSFWSSILHHGCHLAVCNSCIIICLFCVFSQVPAHFTNATSCTLSPASSPMIAAIFAATGAPPTGHCPTGASPFAIAAARPEHPAYPHPPQLLPGSSARIASSFSSTSTANFLPAIPRKTPMNTPVPPTISAAINTPVILITRSSFC